MRHLVYLLLIISASNASVPFWSKFALRGRVRKLLERHPVIDGHNDLPYSVRRLLNNNVSALNLDADLTKLEPFASDTMNHIDLPRMRKGMMGGQFWSAYIGCDSQFKDATQKFLEQIDVIKQIIDKYPNDLMWADCSEDIEDAIRLGKVASLIGVESGHAIASSLSVLRTLYELGARYMTLTHTCNTPWADTSSTEDGDVQPESHGLSHFGVKIVHEMNRLGMMVDLSHVSADTMRQAIKASLAPVIFSHSGARAVAGHARNVPDDVLQMVKDNGGIVMVNFYSCFIVNDCQKQTATVDDVVKHINHIREIAGVDHVGIGGDYNGVDQMPGDLPDVSFYPSVFEALINDREHYWSDEDLGKLASGNIIRVLKEVEKTRDYMEQLSVKPDDSWIPTEDLKGDLRCSSNV